MAFRAAEGRAVRLRRRWGRPGWGRPSPARRTATAASIGTMAAVPPYCCGSTCTHAGMPLGAKDLEAVMWCERGGGVEKGGMRPKAAAQNSICRATVEHRGVRSRTCCQSCPQQLLPEARTAGQSSGTGQDTSPQPF